MDFVFGILVSWTSVMCVLLCSVCVRSWIPRVNASSVPCNDTECLCGWAVWAIVCLWGVIYMCYCWGWMVTFNFLGAFC